MFKNQNGQLLLEVLVTVAVSAIIIGISANLIIVSLNASKKAGERTIASNLLKETLEVLDAVGREKWHNIYNVIGKGAANHYYPVRSASEACSQSGTKWCFAAGDENVIIEGATYVRYFYIENVCRGDSSRSITTAAPCSPGDSEDPSTQKITAAVVFGQGETLTRTEYLSRWPNETCVQTQWTSSGQGGPVSCPTAGYDSSSNISAGASLQLQ